MPLYYTTDGPTSDHAFYQRPAPYPTFCEKPFCFNDADAIQYTDTYSNKHLSMLYMSIVF